MRRNALGLPLGLGPHLRAQHDVLARRSAARVQLTRGVAPASRVARFVQASIAARPTVTAAKKERDALMGDKSPKAKDKNKKQDSAQKKAAKDDADAKKAAPATPKKGK